MRKTPRMGLVAGIALTCVPVFAKDARDVQPAPQAPHTVSAKPAGGGHGRVGLLVGVAGGIAAGFVIASLTDYPLEEGGAYGVMLLGGGLGALVGQKIGSSVGRPWEEPGRLAVSLAYAWTTAKASRDLEAAFAASGFPATNDSHSIAPSVLASYRVARQLHAGLELSGVSPQWFRAMDAGTFLTESVGGKSYGIVVSYAPMPTERRRLTYALGAGLDYYDVTVESYFDPIDASYPEDQPDRASRKTDHTLGLQLRGSLECWLVHDVSLQASVVGRWSGSIEVPEITLIHPLPDRTRSLPGHSVSLSSLHLQVGFGMRF